MDPNDTYISHADTVRRIGAANPNTAHSLLTRAGLRQVRVGGRWMWYRKDIEDLMARADAQALLTPRGWRQVVVGNRVEVREVVS